ncbi:MAG: pseudaminic acid synthase [Halobacteriovorax sp.]|nr:pseudaminic acid synthase [Halobacteriovorax sp.]
MKIGKLDTAERCIIVAELSANHNGSLKTAIETIAEAAKAGADAIKLQTYTADTMTINSDSEDFVIKSGTIWDGRKLYELYQEAYTPWEWHEELYRIAREEGLECFSTPFDRTAVDFLESINNPVYKVASFEITDIPLLRYVASKHRPIILSSGIATEDDIALAIETIRKVSNVEIGLLKCTSSYPAPYEEANLALIERFKKDFSVPPGISDHTLGHTAPILSVAFGARIIEKHFIIDRSIGGADASFSMNPTEFKAMVEQVRIAEKLIGRQTYEVTSKARSGRVFSRSIYFTRDLKKGEVITEDSVAIIRPGLGLAPKYYDQIVGKKMNAAVTRGQRVQLELIDE